MSAHLTIQEAAEDLGISARSYRRYIAQRKVAVIRLGHRTVRIARAEHDRFKQKRTERSIF